VITLEECTAQQLDALDNIEAWWADWHDSGHKQVWRQDGFAGVGKTSLARLAARRLGVEADTFYAAFTGKAAHVLRSKGCVGAQTIHSLIYQPADQSRARLMSLHHQLQNTPLGPAYDELAAEIEAEQEKLGRAAFTLRDDSELRDAALLVLDESSMVGHKIGQDLLSFGVPMLVLGDPMQLPPIEGTGFFMQGRPDHLLTELQRSALESPVTRVVTTIRQADPADPRFGVYGRDGNSGRFNAVRAADLPNYDQVIVGRNRTRWNVISRIRAARGWTTPVPRPGDRIIVLANNGDLGVYNGQQFTVEDCDDRQPGRYLLEVCDDEGAGRMLTCWSRGFEPTDDKTTRETTNAGRRGAVATATFAQAITCHKAQGSQYGHVLVIDESWVFRTDAQRWLYTAATRAERQIVIVREIR